MDKNKDKMIIILSSLISKILNDMNIDMDSKIELSQKNGMAIDITIKELLRIADEISGVELDEFPLDIALTARQAIAKAKGG